MLLRPPWTPLVAQTLGEAGGGLRPLPALWRGPWLEAHPPRSTPRCSSTSRQATHHHPCLCWGGVWRTPRLVTHRSGHPPLARAPWSRKTLPLPRPVAAAAAGPPAGRMMMPFFWPTRPQSASARRQSAARKRLARPEEAQQRREGGRGRGRGPAPAVKGAGSVAFYDITRPDVGAAWARRRGKFAHIVHLYSFWRSSRWGLFVACGLRTPSSNDPAKVCAAA